MECDVMFLCPRDRAVGFFAATCSLRCVSADKHNEPQISPSFCRFLSLQKEFALV